MQESARSRNAAGHVHVFYCMLADLQLLHTCTQHTMMVNNKLCGFLWWQEVCPDRSLMKWWVLYLCLYWTMPMWDPPNLEKRGGTASKLWPQPKAQTQTPDHTPVFDPTSFTDWLIATHGHVHTHRSTEATQGRHYYILLSKMHNVLNQAMCIVQEA